MLLMFSGAMFLMAFSKGCQIVHGNRLSCRFLWTLERIRASIAYEGDPGPWKG